MSTRKMSITEALVELKTLDARINKSIAIRWCGVVKCKDEKDPKTLEIAESIKAKYQSVTDLIEERAKIKSAIVKSNAVTEVTVAGETMTVAEAIERKSSIDYEKDLLSEMQTHLIGCMSEVGNENRKVATRFDAILEKLVGSDRNNISEEHKAIAETYRQANEVMLLDPLNLESKIEALEKKITDFESNIDVALSMSNATTFIYI